MNKALRIGSRGSELALWQAQSVQQQLARFHPDVECSLLVIKTGGDIVQGAALWKMGNKGIFIREIETALLNGEIDLAVHSLKDLPTQLPDGLVIGAITERADVRDVFIPHPANRERTLEKQPHGAKIATGSLRRRSQLLSLRPDLEIIDFRGNVNTRFRKLGESDWAGMILAKAGVERLGMMHQVGETLEATVMLPAVGQGALAIEVRDGDTLVADLVGVLNHQPTAQVTTAERALLRRLEGGCQIPVGALGRIESANGVMPTLTLDAMVGSLDGKTVVRAKTKGLPEESEKVGAELAEILLRNGAAGILQSIRNLSQPGVVSRNES